MVDYTRPATWDDVKTLARYLADERVEYRRVLELALERLRSTPK